MTTMHTTQIDHTIREMRERTAESEAEAADHRARDHALSPAQRLERLENICSLHFGVDLFSNTKPLVFNPDAERDSARARFQQEMERIEAEARKIA